MRTIRILTIVFFTVLATGLKAQDSTAYSVKPDVFSLGAGFGFEYGGLGGNLLVYPTKNVGLFAGVGWALADMGYNVGAKVRFFPKKPNSPLTFSAIAMYGYNASVVVYNDKSYNKLFYGPTVGVGLDFKLKPTSKGYWSISLLIPIRSSEVNDYMDDLEDNHGVEFNTRLWPVGTTVGYRFIIK